jgi:hypothetical protein
MVNDNTTVAAAVVPSPAFNVILIGLVVSLPGAGTPDITPVLGSKIKPCGKPVTLYVIVAPASKKLPMM